MPGQKVSRLSTANGAKSWAKKNFDRGSCQILRDRHITARMIDYMQKGGPLMWLILFCSVIFMAVFLERLTYFHRATIRVGEFLRGLSNLVQRRILKDLSPRDAPSRPVHGPPPSARAVDCCSSTFVASLSSAPPHGSSAPGFDANPNTGEPFRHSATTRPRVIASTATPLIRRTCCCRSFLRGQNEGMTGG